MLRKLFWVALAGFVVAGLSENLVSAGPVELGDSIRAKIADAAKIDESSFEATKKARNNLLNELFRQYMAENGGKATAEMVARFNAEVKKHGMTNFDDFLLAETTPLREVKDPVSGNTVPVVGALGSDLINPWLAACKIVEGAPTDEQPVYRAASNALREHIDFALVGVADPNLSLDRLPAALHENCKWAYSVLSPDNRFNGGFDHPLFYATIRIAAMKLFRQDYPQAKLTMAQLVVPEEKGGFGIRSCLLCHDRDHAGVYKRTIGQSLFHELKARRLAEGSQEHREAKAKAEDFALAAKIILEAFPDKIDPVAVRQSLETLSTDNVERLKPGYDQFRDTLQTVGCLKCHNTENEKNPEMDPEMNPMEHGAYALNPNAYYKTANIQSLLMTIDVENLDNSLLLMKARSRLAEADAQKAPPNTVTHEGANELVLTEAEVKKVRDALKEWIYSFKENQNGK